MPSPQTINPYTQHSSWLRARRLKKTDFSKLAQALREAQLETLKKQIRLGDTEVSLAHPLFWAPFVLIGGAD